MSNAAASARPLRPLSPNTLSQYQRALSRVGISDVGPTSISLSQLPRSNASRGLLRAAVKWLYKGRNQDPTQILSQIPLQWEPRRVVEIPGEVELTEFEKGLKGIGAGHRAVILLPLVLGLRAQEALALERERILKASKTGELLIMRKGSKEQILPAKHAVPVFEALLSAGAAPGRPRVDVMPSKKGWRTVGEILSPGAYITQYHQLNKLVHQVGKSSGVDLRPHKLRHAFATRMSRDGADVRIIQWMLGHAQLATTMRYVHPDAASVERFMRPVAMP